jgi:hypothetical protein
MSKLQTAAVLAALVAWQDDGANPASLADIIERARALTEQAPAPTRKGQQPGEAFYHALIAAKRSAFADDPRWDLRSGARWVTLPARLAAFKTDRGNRIAMGRDQKIPPAEYWPGGIWPAGVVA